MSKLKLCPYLPQKKEVKAMMVGNGDCVVTYFHPCLGEDCAAYLHGNCMYGGANIPVVKDEATND